MPEGHLGSESEPSYCELSPETELQRYNDEYEVPIYAPGYFAFASNGGGEKSGSNSRCFGFVELGRAGQSQASLVVCRRCRLADMAGCAFG